MERRYPNSLGFKTGKSSTHTSRTIMLTELSALMEIVGAEASKEEYRREIIDENALGKKTASTCRLTAQRLSELYALDRSVPIFRLLRRLWEVDPSSQPLLALLCSLARDPLLRSTADPILCLGDGRGVDRDAITEALSNHAKDRINPSILDKVARNAAASWTQSGHLEGLTFKKRRLVTASVSSAVMALFLGYLQGLRGPGLYKTLWCQVLDSSPDQIARLASRAAMAGLMRFRQSGDVIEIGFPEMLTQAELEETTHG